MKIKSISKQALAVLLSLSVLASTLMLNTFSVFATGGDTATGDTTIKYWDRTIAEIPQGATHPYDSGEGTSTDPFLISTGEQLAYLTTTSDYSSTNGKYYKLTNDIYLNDVTDPEWYVNGTPKPWLFQADENKAFSGTLDGDGHTIYGLYINGAYSKAGLFAAIGNTVIKNLKISKSYVSNTRDNNYAGVAALAGFRGAWGTLTISNCAIDDDVQIIGKSGCVGGFIGYIQGNAGITTIENCYSGAKLTQTATWFAADCLVREFVGGRKDDVSANLTIKSSYTTGSHELANSNDTKKPTFENCYTTNAASTETTGVTVLTKAQMTGAKATIYMNTFDFKKVWYTADDKTPQLRLGKDKDKTNAKEFWKVWDGNNTPVNNGYDGGSGTSADPYLISTPEQLLYACAVDCEGNKYYFKLTDDIYLNDVSTDDWYKEEKKPKEWKLGRGQDPTTNNTDAKIFYAHLNGAGHTIYGLYINAPAHNKKEGKFGYFTGLIPRFGKGASIENLSISKAYVKSANFAGGHGVLVGTSWQNTKITNCVIDETVQFVTNGPGSPMIGSLENNKSTHTDPVKITDCYVAAEMSTSNNQKPSAFLGIPFVTVGNDYVNPINYTTSSHLVVTNSYYSGNFGLAPEKISDTTDGEGNTVSKGAVRYEDCYTTNANDVAVEDERVEYSETLEAMLSNGLTDVLNVFPKLGNVNGVKDNEGKYDNTIDICDLVKLKKFILKPESGINIYSSDVNNDREINGMDFVALKRYILDDASVFQ